MSPPVVLERLQRATLYDAAHVDLSGMGRIAMLLVPPQPARRGLSSRSEGVRIPAEGDEQPLRVDVEPALVSVPNRVVGLGF